MNTFDIMQLLNASFFESAKIIELQTFLNIVMW